MDLQKSKINISTLDMRVLIFYINIRGDWLTPQENNLIEGGIL
jgi:hypothetical protein